MSMPQIVDRAEWDRARAELLAEEKAATRALDALAARRRRLPMVEMGEYSFAGPGGPVTLLELFEGRSQLVTYQFMDAGPEHLCGGCTNFTDNVTALDRLAAEGISWATVSDMPLEQIERGAAEHGWTMRFVSSRGTGFAADCGSDGGFVLSAFLRDGDRVYRTYSTTSRGVDRLMFLSNIQDLAVYGRQQDWEDSPAGWPQHPTYG